jgi:hypothetical protein
MIKVHHLNDSRSQRVLWLLEELGLEEAVQTPVNTRPNPFGCSIDAKTILFTADELTTVRQ